MRVWDLQTRRGRSIPARVPAYTTAHLPLFSLPGCSLPGRITHFHLGRYHLYYITFPYHTLPQGSRTISSIACPVPLFRTATTSDMTLYRAD